MVEVGQMILDDLEVDAVAVNGHDTNVAAVERGADLDAHLTVIVTPDSPGKPWKSACASRAAIGAD